MVSKASSGTDKAAIVALDQAALARYVPDLQNWPASWRFEDEDIPPGQALVQVFTPFLQHLLAQGYARKTLNRHRDYLWMLGGETIRRRHEDPDVLAMPVVTLLHNLLEEDGGPLIWPRISESEQNSFDATCRKLYHYLNQSPNA